ncbi:MAG: hypothetical protein OJF51_001886 [Nitrospira sp.]|nr:MAG: hypothetical protein OJF51_001886 [Nitrospira sp.]
MYISHARGSNQHGLLKTTGYCGIEAIRFLTKCQRMRA